MNFKKLFLLWVFFSLSFFLVACKTDTDTPPLPAPTNEQKINENTYIYYYGQACSYCKKVEDYLRESWVDQRITIQPKEITMNAANRDECLAMAEELEIPISQVGTPFIIVVEPDGNKYGLMGADEVLDHFKALEEEIKKLNS